MELGLGGPVIRVPQLVICVKLTSQTTWYFLRITTQLHPVLTSPNILIGRYPQISSYELEDAVNLAMFTKDIRKGLFNFDRQLHGPDVAPLLVEPDLAQFLVELDLAPLLVEPDLAPLLVEPDHTPLLVKPDLGPLLVEPDHAPLLVEPNLAPLLIEPDLAPLLVEPDLCRYLLYK